MQLYFPLNTPLSIDKGSYATIFPFKINHIDSVITANQLFED